MPRSRKRQRRSPTLDTTSSEKKVLQIKSVSPDLTESLISSNLSSDNKDKRDIVTQYYDIAEAMNNRGAMDMAVPFYRQAIALLLAERESLNSKLKSGLDNHPISELTVHNSDLLLHDNNCATNDSVDSAAFETRKFLETKAIEEVEVRISELSKELSKNNALQVMAGLKIIAKENNEYLPPSGLSLLGKLQAMLGRPSDALESFEAALDQSPQDIDFQINVGAARLTVGNVSGALDILRSVFSRGLSPLSKSQRRALLRNLASAEDASGDSHAALNIRFEWFKCDAVALPVNTWLQWIQQSLREADHPSPFRQQAILFLKAIWEANPNDRQLLQSLADALEEQGDYREAARLYRKLLI